MKTLRERNRMHVQEYYKRSRNDIIKQKTLKMAECSGRVPRLETIQTHGIDYDNLCTILKKYMNTHTEKTRTCDKIKRFLVTFVQPSSLPPPSLHASVS